jgi:hypothetical protein
MAIDKLPPLLLLLLLLLCWRGGALPPAAPFRKLLAPSAASTDRPSVHVRVIFDATLADGAEQETTHRIKVASVPGVDFAAALREEAARIAEGGPNELYLCVHYTPWCQRGASPNDPCEKHRHKKHTCRPVAAYDKDGGFQIHLRGTVRVQFTITDNMGFTIAISGPTELRAPADVLSGTRKRADYFEKFQFEEDHHPFGDTYYSLFATMITHMFRGKGQENHGTTIPFVSTFDPAAHYTFAREGVTAVEIGIARGGHSSSILKDLPQHALLNKLYGVDPYIAGYDDEDIFAARKQNEFDAMHDWVRQRMVKEESERSSAADNTAEQVVASRFRQLRTGSADAAARLKARGEKVHAVFVDGDHRADAVKTDLAAWYPLLVPGGLMMGDDFHLHTVSEGVHLWLDTLPEGLRPKVHAVSKPGSESYQLFAFVKPSA